MKFKIRAARKGTGDIVEFVVSAPSKFDAEEIAFSKNVLIEKIARVDILYKTRCFFKLWCKKKRVYITAIILSILCSVALFRTKPGHIPTPDQIQAKLKVWEVRRYKSVLRGRPNLTVVDFQSDASRHQPIAPDFSVWIDKHNVPVAITCMIGDAPTKTDPGIGSLFWTRFLIKDVENLESLDYKKNINQDARRRMWQLTELCKMMPRLPTIDYWFISEVEKPKLTTNSNFVEKNIIFPRVVT